MTPTLSIARTSSADGPDAIRVQLIIPGQLVAVTLTMEDFARAVTGEMQVPCTLVRNAAHQT